MQSESSIRLVENKSLFCSSAIMHSLGGNHWRRAMALALKNKGLTKLAKFLESHTLMEKDFDRHKTKIFNGLSF